MTLLKPLLAELETTPSTVRSDVEAVAKLMGVLGDVLGGVYEDVFIDRAVLQLTNSNGYPVGHITFDADPELYQFIPHQDKEED